jgi:hypothetical protein
MDVVDVLDGHYGGPKLILVQYYGPRQEFLPHALTIQQISMPKFFNKHTCGAWLKKG